MVFKSVFSTVSVLISLNISFYFSPDTLPTLSYFPPTFSLCYSGFISLWIFLHLYSEFSLALLDHFAWAIAFLSFKNLRDCMTIFCFLAKCFWWKLFLYLCCFHFLIIPFNICCLSFCNFSYLSLYPCCTESIDSMWVLIFERGKYFPHWLFRDNHILGQWWAYSRWAGIFLIKDDFSLSVYVCVHARVCMLASVCKWMRVFKWS